MTRIESIRMMSSHELAKELDRFEGLSNEICRALDGECPYMDNDGEISVDCDCIPCIVKWLESEVEK